MSKKIAILGGGISGLVACKHLVAKGFNPVVFEAKGTIGGVWASQAIDSTKLQTPKGHYQFSDFKWPPSVHGEFPRHDQVLEYLHSYAVHFNLFPFIKFHSKVVSVDYRSGGNLEPEESWEPFSRSASWRLLVQDTSSPSLETKAYEFDFVIVCIGKYSEVVNIPEFPKSGGPEAFNGKVMHSMDYAAMESRLASELTHQKRVTVVGFQKSAVDLAAQIATQNGSEHPCTILYKNVHWMVPEDIHAKYFKLLNRFSESMIPKPGQCFFSRFVTFLLSLWLWLFSRIMEMYLKWRFPLKKYDVVPGHNFADQISTCKFTVLPANFFDRVEEGSLILKRTSDFQFCKEGLLLDGISLHATDIVVFATGYNSQQKLANIFLNPAFRDLVLNSSAPFYRECIHPRIPQLAILGYSDSPSILYTSEMRSKWVVGLLEGKFKLPSVAQMEKETLKWQKCMENYVGKDRYKKTCTSVSLQIHCNDLICKDMGINPRRKKCFIQELFATYGPSDYANLD